MTSILSIALLTQLLLVLSGLALLQIANYKERIQILPLIPFAWGTGAVLLYLMGRIFVKSEWLLHDWHLVVAGGMALLIIIGAFIYLRGPPGQNEIARIPLRSIRWYDALLITLILIKVILVTYICMVNSVTDSDATAMRGYVALAKKIGEGVSFSEVMDRGTGHTSPLGPSLLSAWIRMFQDRWHDSIGSLPWLLAWLFGGGIAFITCDRLSRHLTASLACAYLFLSLPFATIHVIRSGFHDLLTMYFFIAGISVLSCTFLVGKKPGAAWLTAGMIAILGVALCKTEGKMWALFLAVMWINYYLLASSGIAWKKLIAAQLLLAAVALVVYYLAVDKEFLQGFENQRLRLMAPRAFEKEAFAMTVTIAYGSGSFGIWWWATGLAGIYLLVARKVPAMTKITAFFVFSILLAIVFFANFTENIQATLIGINVSRFLLQVAGLLLPLYCALTMLWLPPDGNDERAEPG